MPDATKFLSDLTAAINAFDAVLIIAQSRATVYKNYAGVITERITTITEQPFTAEDLVTLQASLDAFTAAINRLTNAVQGEDAVFTQVPTPPQ